MKKFFGILLAALLLVAMAAGMAFTSSAASGNVVYIASNGTGDGSSPDSPLGNTPGYAEQVAADIAAQLNGVTSAKKGYMQNAFYLAADKLKETGGTIVIVGETVIDSADAFRAATAEFSLPANNGILTITSKYDGVDYAASGAKLVLDKSEWGSVANINVRGKSVWENLTIEYKHVIDSGNKDRLDPTYEFGSYICCNTNETVFGEGLNMISESGIYPFIIAGARYSAMTTSPKVTVKSGKWGYLFTGNYMTAKLTGNPVINIEGTADIGTVVGGGSLGRKTAKFSGNLTINMSGGSIGSIYGTDTSGNDGEVAINVTGGKIGSAAVTPDNLASSASVPKKSTISYPLCPTTITGAVTGFTEEVKTNAHDLDDTNHCKVCLELFCEHQYEDYYVPPTCVDQGMMNHVCKLCGASYVDSYENPTGTHKYVDGFCSVCHAEQPDVNVIYIGATSTGKGDGSSPNDVLGHAANYYEIRSSKDSAVSNTAYKLNALYRAFKKLVSTGGTIVVTQEFKIDSANALRSSAAEFSLPANKSKITITSLHKGVDYAATAGAKIILDKSEYNVNLMVNGVTEWKNLVLVSKSNAKAIESKSADKAFIFEGNGNAITFGEGIVSQLATKDSIYPAICGGGRYSGKEDSGTKMTTNVTVKSGSWSEVVGGVYGLSGYGFTEGNINVNIEGGVITTLTGTTSLNYKTGLVTGDVILNITGGEVGVINGTGHYGLDGDVKITIEPEAKVGVVYGTCDGFKASGNAIPPKNIVIDNRGVKGSTDPVKSGTLLTVLMVTAFVSLAGAAVAVSKKKKAIR